MTVHLRHTSARAPLPSFWLILRLTAWLGLLPLLSAAWAQNFSSSLYYQQCLRFEALGDLETAYQSCLNALEVSPSVSTKLALARIELGLGKTASAEARLNEVRNQTDSAEPYVLLAELAVSQTRVDAAAGFLRAARERLSQNVNSELEGRFYLVEGKVAAARGDYAAAQRAYQNAGASEPLNQQYPLALAELLFKLGDLSAARNELEAFQQFTGSPREPALLSLLGRIKWAQSDLGGAVGDLETAVALRGSENTSAQAEDLRALALVYYGQGDIRAGNLALRAALRRSTLLLDVLNRTLLWLVLLVGLLAAHLLGESRAVKSRTLLAPDANAQPTWTLLQVYAVLAVALALALGVAFVYGVVRYENYLAFLTPLQSGDVRALFFACLGALLFLFTVLRVNKNGADPVETLLGNAHRVALGAVVGLGLAAVTLLYLAYLPRFGVFYLDFSRLTPSLIAAVVLAPLSEVFFRGFAMPPLLSRYPRPYAVVISGTLFAIVFASPVLLMLAVGLVLAEFFRRTGNGLATLVASLVLHLSLVVGVALLPWVRQLFV